METKSRKFLNWLTIDFQQDVVRAAARIGNAIRFRIHKLRHNQLRGIVPVRSAIRQIDNESQGPEK